MIDRAAVAAYTARVRRTVAEYAACPQTHRNVAGPCIVPEVPEHRLQQARRVPGMHRRREEAMSRPNDLRACHRCGRCGRRRYVKNTRPNAALCGDCLDVEPDWPNVLVGNFSVLGESA